MSSWDVSIGTESDVVAIFEEYSRRCDIKYTEGYTTCDSVTFLGYIGSCRHSDDPNSTGFPLMLKEEDIMQVIYTVARRPEATANSTMAKKKTATWKNPRLNARQSQ